MRQTRMIHGNAAMTLDSFRLAIHADAAAIAKLVNRAYRPEQGEEGWTHESDLVADARTTPLQVAEALGDKEAMILLGLRGPRIVACVQLDKDGDSCWIGMLAVDPDFQGQGLGKQMLAQAEAHAVADFGVTRFAMAVVSARTELLAFYLRRGYRQTGEVMEYPVALNVGTPKQYGLKVEVLEKNAP